VLNEAKQPRSNDDLNGTKSNFTGSLFPRHHHKNLGSIDPTDA
jgi:hypothetical protein